MLDPPTDSSYDEIQEILAEIGDWCQRFGECKIIITGDYKVNLVSNDATARNIASFAHNQSLSRREELFPNEKTPHLRQHPVKSSKLYRLYSRLA